MARFGGNTVGVAVVCLAQFVVVLDATIVATALPAIRDSLGFATADLQWVVTSYTLVFGGFLVAGGRLADLCGPRRMFAAGLTVFGVASVVCAVAWAPVVLIAARAGQGLGAAVLSPAALALLTTLSEPGTARRRAVGAWTAVAAVGGASGWVLGGLLTEYLSWRFVFWVNLPVGLLALVAAVRVLPAGRRATGTRLDLPGTLAATAALALLVYGLAGLAGYGPAAWRSLLLAGVLFAGLVAHERRLAEPLVPAELLRSRPVVAANLTALLLTGTTTPAMFLSILYVHQVLGFSTAGAALLFPVFNLAVVAGSVAGPWLLRSAGARVTLVGGFAGIGAGVAVLVALPGAAGLLTAFALMGAGLGAASVASTHTGTEAAAPDQRGIASGVLNSAAQLGTALGLAVVTPLATGGADGDFRVGFLATAALAVVGLAAGMLAPPRRPARRSGQAPERVGADQV